MSLFIPEKRQSHRQLRVAEEIREILSALLSRREWPGAELVARPITVTHVLVSADLQNARAYIMPLGGGDAQEDILTHVNDAQKFFRFYLGKSLKTKFTPKVVFCLDTSFDQADRISALLRKYKETEEL